MKTFIYKVWCNTLGENMYIIVKAKTERSGYYKAFDIAFNELAFSEDTVEFYDVSDMELMPGTYTEEDLLLMQF